MVENKREYIDPEILIIKFGCEDIITASPDLDNTDPYVDDPFDD